MEKFINHIQLGYLGLIPFLGCVGWPLVFGSNSINLEFFTFYSIAILAFMTGNLWRAGEQSYSDALKAVLPVIPVPFLAFVPVEWALAWLADKFLACAYYLKKPLRNGKPTTRITKKCVLYLPPLCLFVTSLLLV